MSQDGEAADVSVIIVSHQSGPTLARCLTALREQTAGGFEVLLCDNASTDGASQAAAATFDVRLFENAANLGFAAGNNRGAEAARGRWLVLLNPDAYAEPGFIAALLAAARRFPAVRCFTARQKMAADAARLDGLGDAMTIVGFPFRGAYGAPDPGPIPAAEVFSPCGAAMMIERALFLRMGGFDERFFCYCEDADLGYRLRLIGEPVLLAPEAVVAHEGSVSTGGRRSDFSLYHGARNRLWLFIKDTPPLLFWATLPLHLLGTLALWLRATIRGEAEPVERGIEDALKAIRPVWAERRRIQRERTVSSWAVAALMVWNPLDAMRRRGRTRPWPSS